DLANDGEVRNVVRIVHVQHRPLHDSEREIRCATAIAVELNLCRQDISFVVKPNIILREKPMALAGNLHVIVAKEPDFDRASCRPAEECSPARSMICLGFFAAESPTHTPDLYHHLMLPNAKHPGNERLCLGRMLS